MTTKKKQPPKEIQDIEIDLNNIRFIKLTNGEDIIAALVSEDDYRIEVFVPCKVYYHIQEEEEGVVCTETSLLPWFQNSDVKYIVYLYKHHVISMANPTKSYRDFYVRVSKSIFEDPVDSKTEEGREEMRTTLINEDVRASQVSSSKDLEEYYTNKFREMNKFVH